MKSFLKLSSITLLMSLGMWSKVHTGAMTMSMPSGSIPSESIAIPSHSAAPMPSVHDMFKDIPQDELLMMMEEGQQFIKYLEENGTAEEKMAFAQAMEETLKSFTPDDWAEFEAIVETVQDKLPPMVIEEPKEVKPEIKKEEIKKESVKVVIDNSLEKMILDINKAINAILIKAKSDKILSERIAMDWSKKEEFNEMARLIQVLKSKDHLERLASDKEEIKTLVESLRNFNKRLQIENSDFIIADTFGLEVDEQTSADNLKKLNKIIKFLDSAIESLLPKLIKFLKEFDPQALKIAEERDQDAKKALDHATKIEKQRRPAGMGYSDRSGQNRKHQNQVSYAPGGYSATGTSHTTEQVPGYLETVHQGHLKNVPQLKKTAGKDGAANGSSKSEIDKKDTKKSSYAKSIDSLEGYLETNGNSEVGNYMTTVSKAGNIYAPFGSAISQDDKTRTEQLIEMRNGSDLTADNEKFLHKHQERLQAAHKNFAQNTQAAHTYYADLKDSIESIAAQIDEMQSILSAIKSNIESMSSNDLEKLQHAKSLKSLGQRIATYHEQLKRVQHELRNKHKLHKLERENPYETSAYNDLTKAESLHGLDNKINQVKNQFEALNKAIKSAITRHRREENKKSAQQ
jgi:hypothetical protein